MLKDFCIYIAVIIGTMFAASYCGIILYDKFLDVKEKHDERECQEAGDNAEE